MSILVRYAPVPSTTTDQYEGHLLVSEVWDSREQFEAFGQRVMPLLTDVALEHSGRPEILETHNIIRR